MIDEPMRVEIRLEAGEEHLALSGGSDFREVVCPVCHEPIRWVLDMSSFMYLHGGYRLAHARCVWTTEGFDREKQRVTRGSEPA